MNKLNFALIGWLGLFFLIGPIGVVSSHAGIEVSPMEYNFGEVEVGNSSTVIVTILNTGYEPLWIDISFEGDSSSDFYIGSVSLPIVLQPTYSTYIEVTFTPSSEGPVTDVLIISWCNGESGEGYVDLSGVGVAASPPLSIADILSFFDAGVEAGTIQGTGPSDNAKLSRLKVFKLKLLMVEIFLESGATREACTLLWHAYERSDGQGSPPDFIKGQDVDEINAMILQLWADFGCE